MALAAYLRRADDAATAAELRHDELAAFVRSGGAARVEIDGDPWRFWVNAKGRIGATHFTTGYERVFDLPKAEALLAPLMAQASPRKASDGEPPRRRGNTENPQRVSALRPPSTTGSLGRG